jgi:light-regulated signal transduction histidine kinase (bacteriophytochrome)
MEQHIAMLTRSLFAKNRELESLNFELKTFTTIVTNEYIETLRHLYTSLEYVISNDAKNLSDTGKANVRRAQAAIQKMKLLTDDIVAFSKITTNGNLSLVDLNEILSNVLLSLANKIAENRVKINYNCLPVINGYPTLLSVLFSHLIDNAIKFKKEEIEPQVTITHSQQDGMDIKNDHALKDIRYDVISVMDNGIGFDPKDADKIFTMFYKLGEKGKNKGSGIGLAICKKIMDLHGGFIVAECIPECTIFRCFFPSAKFHY